MADKVIGVDVGTSAVRAAEVALGHHPRLLRFGQVALPADAVVEGEVADVDAVAEALRRLWREVGFRGKSVRAGIASARVILRMVEVPELSEDDTRSALGLQLGDYVPLAPEATVFGFQPIAGPQGWAGGPEAELPADGDGLGGEPAEPPGGAGVADGGAEGSPLQRLLLAAAHRDAVTPLIEAVRRAGLKVEAVDVIPAALARALTAPSSEGVGNPPVEAIVSLGAGTTIVVVAEGGTPVFSRTITSVSGRQTTERIAEQLDVPFDQAERAKRLTAATAVVLQAAGAMMASETSPAPPAPHDPSHDGAFDGGSPDALVAGARAAARPAVIEAVAEVADSLDYFTSQPAARPVDRVVLAGGGLRLAGVADLLEERLGLPVEIGDPFRRIDGVPAGFEPVDLPFLAPYLPGAAGIALGGGRRRGPRIDLRPTEGRAGRRKGVPLVAAIVAAIALLAAGVLYWQRRGAIASEEAATETVRQELSQLQAAAAGGSVTATAGGGVTAAGVARAALANDPDWLAAGLRLEEIGAAVGVEVESLKGTVTAATPQGSQTTAGTGATTTTAAGGAPATTTTAAGAQSTGAPAASGLGTLDIAGATTDLDRVATWFEAVGADPRFAGVWISAISPEPTSGLIKFTAKLTLTGENLVPRTLREPTR